MYRVIKKTVDGYRLKNNLAVIPVQKNWKDWKGRLYTPVRYKGVIVGFNRKNTLTEAQKALYSTSEDGKAYIAYNERIGGESLGLDVPVGYPEGVEEQGGVIAVYEKCIEKGIAWEELLGVYYEYDPLLVDGERKQLETAYRLLKSH